MKKYFRILIIVLLFAFSKVSAMSLKPTGSTKGTPGGNITVYITLSRSASEKEISAIDGILSYDSSFLELKTVSSQLTGWSKLSDVANNKKFSFANLTYDALINETTKNVIKLVFTVNTSAEVGSSTIINLTNPKATDNNGDGVSITGGSLTISIPSNENGLKELIVNGNLLENFSSSVTNYTYNVASSVTEVKIGATPVSSSATITGVGTKKVNYGSNKFAVTVTSEGGTKKNYIINVIREDNRDTTNTLSSLTVDGKEINGFNKDKTNYVYNVSKAITSLELDAVATNKDCKINGLGTKNLSFGSNKFEIVVTAANGSKKTYNLEVIREDTRSNVNTLDALNIKPGLIKFDPEILEYEVEVGMDVDKVIIDSSLSDPSSTYVPEFGNREVELVENSTEILVKVAASNGTIKTYTIRVNKVEKIISSNKNLSEFSIKGYDFELTDEETYVLKINDEEKLNINIKTEDEDAKYEIIGNQELINGSLIKIIITAADNTQKIYKIYTLKDLARDTSRSIPIWQILPFVAVIIAVMVVIIIKTRKPKKIENTSLNINNEFKK